MQHRIELSNGMSMCIEECGSSITIATFEGQTSEIGAYICLINANGVMVYPNSGDATEILTRGMKEGKEG